MTALNAKQVAVRLIRVAFVAVFATMLATGTPVAAADGKGGGRATTMGCNGGCM